MQKRLKSLFALKHEPLHYFFKLKSLEWLYCVLAFVPSPQVNVTLDGGPPCITVQHVFLNLLRMSWCNLQHSLTLFSKFSVRFETQAFQWWCCSNANGLR